ncbi:MAG: flagellar motor protein MotB [Candidatus Omnitrophota bacterium]
MERQGVKIKKVKKGEDHKAHGGSWKVAYADFVTAMMAFFLLMWLVTAKKMEEKIGLQEYFQEYDVTKGEADIKKKIDEKIKKLKITFNQADKDAAPIKPIFINKYSEAARKIMDEWKNEIQQKLTDVSDQVMIEVTEDGALMIQLVDKEGAPMFAAGSTELTPMAKKIMAVLWEKIRQEGVKVAIEGHTDAHRYSAGGKTNWELSTERASSARRELERLGFLPSNLLRVTGLADTKPISADPFSPTNRRISLIFYYFNNPENPSLIPPSETGTESATPPTPESSPISKPPNNLR